MTEFDEEYADFETLANLMANEGILNSPSEIHGLITGFIVTGSQVDEGHILHLVLSYLDLQSDASSDLKSLILEVFSDIRQQLSSEDLSFNLLLPDEDVVELYSRLQSLSLWSQGFLVGFGSGSKGLNENEFSDEIQEALRDIVNVANVDPEVNEEEEEDETAFFEVCEYLRVASMLIFAEFYRLDESLDEQEGDQDKPEQLC